MKKKEEILQQLGYTVDGSDEQKRHLFNLVISQAMDEWLKENVKKLKELATMHQIALLYDYCPGEEESDEIIEEIPNIEKEWLIEKLKKYEGYSPYDIESHILKIIKTQLK